MSGLRRKGYQSKVDWIAIQGGGGYQSKVDWIVIQGEWIAIQELSEQESIAIQGEVDSIQEVSEEDSTAIQGEVESSLRRSGYQFKEEWIAIQEGVDINPSMIGQ